MPEEGIPRLELEPIPPLTKSGKDDSVLADPRIHSQKQEGLYYVEYKPLGGVPDIQVFRQLLGEASQMEGAQLRLNADETCYIINLTAEEARQVAVLTEKDTAHTLFEHSVSCIGAAVCQQGLCDSHGTLARIASFLKERAWIPGICQMPLLRLPSTCTVQSLAALGFRGAFTLVNGERASAFQVYAGGSYAYGKEKISEPLGLIATARLPQFFLDLNQTLLEAGQPFTQWYPDHEEAFLELLKKYA